MAGRGVVILPVLPRLFLTLMAAGMELCILYALGGVILQAAGSRPLAPTALLLFFAAAYNLNKLGRKLKSIPRKTALVLAQAALFVVLLELLLKRGPGAFGTAYAGSGLFVLPADFMEGFLLLLIAGVALSAWLSGLALARRSPIYLALASRFDLGVGVLVTALVIAAATGHSLPGSLFLTPAFLSFSLPALALRRAMGEGEEQPLLLYGGIFTAGGGLLALFLPLTGAALFFLPTLEKAAETGNRLLVLTGNFMAPILVRILRIFFSYGSPLESEAVLPSFANDHSGEGIAETGALDSFLARLAGLLAPGLTGLFLCLGLFLLLRHLYRFLPGFGLRLRAGIGKWLQNLLPLLQGFLQPLWTRLALRHPIPRKRIGAGLSCFNSLQRWGRFFGVPRPPGFTALEYGACLARAVPAFREALETIVEEFHRECYGYKPPDLMREESVRRAWRRLRGPAGWSGWLRLTLGPGLPGRGQASYPLIIRRG